MLSSLIHFSLETPKMVLENSANLDQTPQNHVWLELYQH